MSATNPGVWLVVWRAAARSPLPQPPPRGGGMHRVGRSLAPAQRCAEMRNRGRTHGDGM